MHVTELFSVPIFRFTLEQGVTKQEIDFIKTLKRQKNQFNEGTENSYVLDLDPLNRIKQFCQQSFIKSFKKYVSTTSNVDIYITQSWANFTNYKEAHHLHRHSNSYLSGVLYVQTLDDDRIFFKNPNAHNDVLDIEPSEWNSWNTETWWIPAKQNIFVVFPSWLMHAVETKNTHGERISIAVNTFLKGDLGSYGKRTRLVI